MDTSDQVEVATFVRELSDAIVKDMAEIRETELDRSGSFRKADLVFTDPMFNSANCDVFVDRLGRLVVPNGLPWPMLQSVVFEGENELKNVVRRESRYEGEKVVALVIYLEAKESTDAKGCD